MPQSTATNLIISRLAQFSRLSAKVIEKRLTPLGVTFQEMRIAGLLMGEAALTQKDLAAKLSVRPATLSVAISKLEKRGAVKRTVSRHDKRINYLSLTAEMAYSEIDAMLQDLDLAACEGVSKKDLAVTGKVINKLIANIQQLELREN